MNDHPVSRCVYCQQKHESPFCLRACVQKLLANDNIDKVSYSMKLKYEMVSSQWLIAAVRS